MTSGLETLPQGGGEAGRLPPAGRAALRRPDAVLTDRPAPDLDLDDCRAGEGLNRVRVRERTLRGKLQKKNTPSARRRLRKRRRKEARRTRDANHKIAKHVVAQAERTGRGIALEDLGGIRERVRLRKPRRATHSGWSFARLGQFIAHKARRAGAAVVYVDPAYTSRTCAECGHIDTTASGARCTSPALPVPGS